MAAEVKRSGRDGAFPAAATSPTSPRCKPRSRKRATKLGPIAVLVNNAANDERHAVAEVTADYWDHAQNVNLRHHFFAAQAVHPQMRELGARLDHQSLVDRLARRRPRCRPIPPPRPGSSA